MRITALKSDTGLSQTYYLDTYPTVTGVIVTVYDRTKSCLGQWTNNRQDTKDTRPFENVIEYDPRMTEILKYFSL